MKFTNNERPAPEQPRLLTALESEMALLNARFDVEKERALRILENDGKMHLGHNLGAVAHELSKLAAKIEQTERFMRSVKA